MDPDRPLIRSGQDYRVMAPALLMDPNRNRVAVAFDALGLVVGNATMGAPEDEPHLGDSLSGFKADLTRAEIDRFFAGPRGPAAHEFLADASKRIVYDLWRYCTSRRRGLLQPIYSASIARETHSSDPPASGETRLQVSVGYSDGFGRVIQKKSTAEHGPLSAPAGAEIGGSDRVVGERWAATGWTIFNNKDKPVRKYEPFFTATHRFEPNLCAGVSAILFYDPLLRVVGALHPDHSWQKIVFDPWSQTTWDAGDTTLIEDPRSDPDVGDYFARIPEGDYFPTWYALRAGGALGADELAAARQAATYTGTPSTAYTDPIGRAYLGVSRNRTEYLLTAGAGEHPIDSVHRNRVRLDLKGQHLAVFDARERLAMRFRYNLAGSRIHQSSMEAGARSTLADASARPLLTWDSRGFRTRTVYDALRRPIEALMRHRSEPERVVGRSVYGESLPHPERANLRTRMVTAHDQAGIASTDRYDFKGNLLRSRRQFARDYRGPIDWSRDVALEAEVYTRRMSYDALNRPVEIVEPDATRVRKMYNDADLIERVQANLRGAEKSTTVLAHVEYDAKGRRTRVDYGNGVKSSYLYDPTTFRLVRAHTSRPRAGFPGDCPDPPQAGWPGCGIQDLHYTYDPMGNVTQVHDRAQQAIFFAGARVEPSCRYTYDAIYRLIEASGREHLGQAGTPIPYGEIDHQRLRLPQPGDGHAMGRYRERYEYDLTGNLLSLAHRGSPRHPGWTREFTYQEASQLQPERFSNRLTSCTVGTTTERFSVAGAGYDASGAMLSLPHLPVLEWDYRDMMQMSQRQRRAEGDDEPGENRAERTWYVYDVQGNRVRKVTERADGSVSKERLYFGSFELFVRREGGGLTRQSLSIMDDQQRVALVETRTVGSDRSPAQLIRYQFSDQLSTVMLELDGQARIITYEEYSAYGSTTYQAASGVTDAPKRYRYTGKERDEETGFTYHGARYYAPWLCRWNTSDPSGLVDGPNLYTYVSDRPTRALDPTGKQGYYPQQVWDRMSAEFQGMIEGVFGGHAYVNARSNTVEYSGPEGGVGGMWGGAVRALTLRIAPIEDNPTQSSLIGMEVGAGFVPIADPGERLVCGTTVTGQDTSRAWAAVQFGMDVLPFVGELHAVSAESRMMSVESSMVSTDVSMMSREGDLATHIGGTSSGTLDPTVTNPTGRGDLCVADVGAHQANLSNPGQTPITNTEMVEASGREVNWKDAPITNAGEASNFLNDAYAELYSQGRIAEPITASVPSGPLEPGEYLAVVADESGGHAIHATVTEEVVATKYISGGKYVSAEEAADLIDEGVKVVERPEYRVEYYDPQKGVCVRPAAPPRSWLRLE